MSFSRWLRSNSEHYLLQRAQGVVARRYDAPQPRPPRGLKDLFWARVFAPVYDVLPWGLRRRVMQSIPGSHRRQWTYPSRPQGPAV
jgi:hypothetical protein